MHLMEYGFVPKWEIMDNIANALIAIEYAKYFEQDVLTMQVAMAKAFQWDSQTMSKMGFGPKLVHVIYYCVLGSHLSQP